MTVSVTQTQTMMEMGMVSMNGQSPVWEQWNFGHVCTLDLVKIQWQDVNVLRRALGVM